MDRLIKIASDILEVAPTELDADSSPKTTKNWDSLRHINLVLALEQGFGVRFAPSEIMMIRTLGQARDLLQQKGATV